MNGRNSIKGAIKEATLDVPKKDRVLTSGKFSRTHVVCVAPGAPLSPIFFFPRITFYIPPPFFRGPRIFFLPLGRPSAAAEGAAKMQDPRGGVRPEKRKEDARTVRRQTRDDPSRGAKNAPERERRMWRTERRSGVPIIRG